MDPTRARALVRLERSAVQSEPFARAHRAGTLSWVKSSILAPLVSSDPLGWFVEDWVAWAGRVTVRRLGEDVERALALSETDPEAFRHGGGLPPESRDDREIGAEPTLPGSPAPKSRSDREIGAPRTVAAEPVAKSRDDREIGAKPTLPEGPTPQASAPEEPCCARLIGSVDAVELFRAAGAGFRRPAAPYRITSAGSPKRW